MNIGVTTLSGGIDSATVTAMALDECDDLLALTYSYGQRHEIEVYAAMLVANVYEKRAKERGKKFEHMVVDLRGLNSVAQHSALTAIDEHAIPTERSADDMSSGVPITYVPGRNTVFVALAAAALDSKVLSIRAASSVNIEASIYVGANALDYSGYPDCRPEFYRAFETVLAHGLAMNTEHGIAAWIAAPIIEMTKAEIVKKAVDYDVPIDVTWSCYAGESAPCQKCDSCILRAKGFAEAEVTDTALLHWPV